MRETIPTATGDLEIERPSWKTPWPPQVQLDWIDLTVPVLLSKPAVAGVFWSHLSDQEPHLYPHAGLLDHAGQPKPCFAKLSACRDKCLG